MEESGTGSTVFFSRAAAECGAGYPTGTSRKLFHFPHSGQRPSHFGSWCEHPLHSNMLFGLDIPDVLLPEDRGARSGCQLQALCAHAPAIL